MKITYDTQYGEAYGEDYAGQSHMSALSCYGPCLLKTIPPGFPAVA